MDYIPIRTNTLRPECLLTFDLYIEIGDHFTHYRRDNDIIETNEIAHLKSWKVKKLHIRPEHEDRYLRYLDQGLEDSIASNLPIEERGQVVQGSMVTLAENAERHFESQEGYQRTEEQFRKIATFVQSDKGALKSILSAAGCSLDDHQHSATVSSLCLALAGGMGVSDQKELLELALAAVVHDLGKAKLKIDLKKKFAQMSSTERTQYKRHPQITLDILSGKPFITPRILGMVSSHEELAFGKGYPESKNLLVLPLPYQILSICNRFEHFCSDLNMPHAEGSTAFSKENEKHFDKDMLATLSSILV